MKKDFVSIFNKDISEDISIDEYELDGLLDKNVEIKENELPAVLIDKEDDTNKYININNSSDLNLLNLNENKNIEDNNEIKTNENEIENNENDFNESYNEENNSYENLEDEVGLTESDLIDIEFVDDFNLEDAVFNSKGNDIYKNNSEKLNISDINDIEETDLIEENNLKKEDEIVECEDKEVVVPSLDDVDYIDESDYINSIDSNEEIIELSGNELDLITKDEDISEDEGNILKVSGSNMRKDNFLLEEQTIENESEHIGDINGIDREKEEQAKTDYYINKYKKLHDEYMKSVEEESKSGEENTISVAESNIELESKPEDNTIEESNIELESKPENNTIEESKEELITETIEPLMENTDESDKTNYYINKYKKLHDEYMKSVEEESKSGEENTISVAESNIELESKPENNIIEEYKEELITETIEPLAENTSELDKTNYYINKYKKLHDEYIKSVEEESKSGEENTISVAESNIELDSKLENNIIEESKEELITKTIEPLAENTSELDKTNYYINKYKKLHDEYMKSIEEESKASEEDTISVAESNIELESKPENNIIEESKETINETECIEEILDNLEVTDKLSVEEEEMYRAYLGEDADLIEEVEDIIPEEIAEKVEKTDENEEMQLNVLEVTDKLSVEEEEMYKAYLGEDANLINEVEDNEEIISKESEDNDEVNIDLEIAKNELKKKEETLSKLEIIGELTADEESLVEDILKQNKNKYYEYDINYSDIILKELDLEEIEEINENDFNILENFILGKEPEEGIELISINNEKNNENEPSKNNDNQIKSIDSFDSIDSEELLKVKETKMPEEKELKMDEQNIDLNVKVEDEFSLNKDDSVLTEEKINQRENNKEDFDGEITQMDLDFAIKLFENEDQKENQGEYGPKHDLLLSENDVVKFRKLFSYFKIIVEKLPQESLKDFSKTEFYDAYSSLFRKFGE